jgi:hypothetical protein
LDALGSGVCSLLTKLSISPERSHFTNPLGRSVCWTETLAGVGPDGPLEEPPQAAIQSAAVRRTAIETLVI